MYVYSIPKQCWFFVVVGEQKISQQIIGLYHESSIIHRLMKELRLSEYISVDGHMIITLAALKSHQQNLSILQHIASGQKPLLLLTKEINCFG